MTNPADVSQQLTLAMIVKDDELGVAETIASVRNIVDEIVVLDTGSSDQTATIAEQNGARVIRSEWQDDFSAARNECLSHINSRWVLWLDAGETMTPDMART